MLLGYYNYYYKRFLKGNMQVKITENNCTYYANYLNVQSIISRFPKPNSLPQEYKCWPFISAATDVAKVRFHNKTSLDRSVVTHDFEVTQHLRFTNWFICKAESIVA